MASRFSISLAVVGMVMVISHCLAARPAVPGKGRKAPASAPAPAAAAPQEVLAEGVCRYTVGRENDPQEEVRFLFRSAELKLPRRGKVTPVIVFRDYQQDLPEGAPEIERLPYNHEVARFEMLDRGSAVRDCDTGPENWARALPSPGLPQERESELLGLPWLTVAPLRPGLGWASRESSDFPHLRDDFDYRVVSPTTLGGRRAWRVERTFRPGSEGPRTVPELKGSARVLRWKETFWVDATGQELLRAERRVQLATQEVEPVQLTLEVDWVRKGTRPLTPSEYRAQARLFDRLSDLERKVKEASARPTLDGAADLAQLKRDLVDLREQFAQRRCQPAFDKLDTAIEQGMQAFQERQRGAGRQG